VPPLLQWKSNDCYITCVCISSLRYPACNVHAPYCHLWPAPLNRTFPHYFINGTIFEKVIEHKMCDSSFYTTFVRSIFHCKKNLTKYDRNCILVLMQSPLYSCPILMELEFSQQSIGKYLNLKFDENSSHGSRVVPCGRTDMTKLIVAFRNFANALENAIVY